MDDLSMLRETDFEIVRESGSWSSYVRMREDDDGYSYESWELRRFPGIFVDYDPDDYYEWVDPKDYKGGKRFPSSEGWDSI